MSPSIAQLLSRFAPQSRQIEVPSRRSAHGSTAWASAANQPGHATYQPQDGVTQRASITDIGLRKAIAGEPEDARITGTTRSLMRRVSGLSVSGVRRAVQPAIPATRANVA